MRDDAGKAGLAGVIGIGVQRMAVTRQAAEIGNVRFGDEMRGGGEGCADLDILVKQIYVYFFPTCRAIIIRWIWFVPS